MSKDQNPSDKACDAYFDSPYAATSGSYYSDRVTFHAGFAAGAASRDAEVEELLAALETVIANAPEPYCAITRAVDAQCRAALAKVRKP